MEIKAKLKHLRMSPRKVRLVADLVRGMNTNQAFDQLQFINKKATEPIKKLLKSGVANAEHNYKLDKNNLLIKEIRVDEGATLKRWMPRAHGRATPLRKRSSHIMLTLDEIVKSEKKESKKTKLETPIKLGSEAIDGKKQLEKSAKKKTEEKKQSKVENKKAEEVEKQIIDPRMQGRRGHAPIEGGKKGFVNKIFRRKTG
ncbi:50S ribosomal protein L22 [Patescibacteria group bacterium]|nr:50S ribosomal protein L22 [Patescibacteria group bacterium]MBU1160565.1 50S ribosomal protein L22 [Patescibacteria group bacterium]MBU1350001.1 50S ribosomal protein L22 [Patescibacteria group bacterium]MBU1421459.1 50S ribosomal protein L22 [Patescibacteria group bacterium]MBU1684186.1 50S ribosomal protein L22 [Patescibacteria group bacterium]